MALPRTGSVSLTTAEQYIDWSGRGKLYFRVDGDDVRIAFDQFSLSNNEYFILDDGTTYDSQPNPFGTQVYVRADSGTATIRWMVTG
jgi:hypothetical protein